MWATTFVTACSGVHENLGAFLLYILTSFHALTSEGQLLLIPDFYHKWMQYMALAVCVLCAIAVQMMTLYSFV